MSGTTPNIGLNVPDHGDQNWDVPVNQNWNTLDAAIAGKQATLTFDSTPTSGSTNPVTSGGIYSAIQAATPAVDNKSVDYNGSSQLEAVGVINRRDASIAVKTWTGTRAQYDAILSKDANTQYMITDTGEIYLGTTQIANLSSVRNIGEIIQSTIPLTDAGLHLLDGSLISGSGSYSAFVTYIAGLYNADPTANYFAQGNGELNWVQPIATASTTAIEGGNMIITTSNEYSSYNGWKAMNGVKSGTNASTSGWGVNNTSATQWWQLKLPYQIRITGIKVYHRYDATPANANVVGRFYTSSNMTTPIGDTLNDTSATNWKKFTISGIPSGGIVTDTLYFQKTGGGNYGGLGEVEITATIANTRQTAEQAWQQSVTNYGVCGKFVYDSTNNTVRLPKITGFTEGTTDVTALGDLIKAGLPNIKGTIGDTIEARSNPTATGALYVTTTSGGGEGNGNYRYFGMGLDASRSSSIYGNSTTVQPQAIKVLYYIVIATSVKTNIEVDIDEVMTDLNGKADVDLSNVNVSGTSLASGWAMPSSRYINLTLGATGSTYTAPANGWFVIRKKASSSGQYWYFGNESAGDLCYSISTHNKDQTVEAFIPAKRGDTIRASYNLGGSTTFFRFIYTEGEKNV